MILTWTHMIHATSTELGAHLVCGSQTKVSDGETEAIVEAEDVLRLQVAVINIQRVAIVYCVEQLKENLPNEIIVSEILSVMEDLREKITVWTVVHNDPGVLLILDDAMKSHNTRMCGGQLMEGDFANVQLPLASCVALVGVRKALDCVRGGT